MYIYWNGQWYFSKRANKGSIVDCGGIYVHIYAAAGKHAIGVEEASSSDNVFSSEEVSAEVALANK